MQTEGLGEPIADVVGSLHRISRMPISSTVSRMPISSTSRRGGCHLVGTQLPPRNGHTVLVSHTEFLDGVPAERGSAYLTERLLTTIKVIVT